MSCGNQLSIYEQHKKALINANLWKSNFINLWKKYGAFKTVGDVECFDYYRIDGAGEGQERMSRHLKQPTLWQDTQNKDLKWVHLVFDFSKFITVTDETIDLWITDTQEKLGNYNFDTLAYTIENDRVTSHAFLLNGIVIDNTFLNDLSLYIAEKKNLTASDVVYSETVSEADISALIPGLVTYDNTPGGNLSYSVLNGTLSTSDNTSPFDISMMERVLRGYSMERGIGTDILDALVLDGAIVGIGNVSTGLMTYALPVETAKKMNGFQFIEMVQNALEFKYKVDSHWYDFFLNIIKLVIAVVAAYFGYYQTALSLTLSFAADVTGSKALKILSAVVSLSSGDIESLSELSASEAISLLLNVYSLYLELRFTPEKNTETEDTEKSDQYLFYKAPHTAYQQIYCYKELISVSIDH